MVDASVPQGAFKNGMKKSFSSRREIGFADSVAPGRVAGPFSGPENEPATGGRSGCSGNGPAAS